MTARLRRIIRGRKKIVLPDKGDNTAFIEKSFFLRKPLRKAFQLRILIIPVLQSGGQNLFIVQS